MLAACATAEAPGQIAQPSPTTTPTTAPTLEPTPQTTLVPLIPITQFASFRDDVALAELTDVLASASAAALVREALPAARVEEVADARVLARVRDGDGLIALVLPEQVEPWVKTLSVEGHFWWDPRLDAARYPLTVMASGATAPDRARLWDLAAAQGIIYGRGVTWGMESFAGGDPFAPFAKVAHVFQEVDVAVSFMESPLSGENNGYCDSCNVFVGDESFAPAVARAGFAALSLATNHTGDAGPQGYLDTIRVLREQGIAPFGAGADLAEARQPGIVEVKGIRVAFVGNNDVPAGCCVATEAQVGHVQFGHDDPEYAMLREQIAAASEVADIVIVMSSLGWPSEYQEWALPQTIAAARAMIDAGATAVLGGQPHWVQGVEIRRDAYIAYAMGNFIQDQMWSDETREGSIHRLFFDGTRLVSVRIIPTFLEDYYQPRLPTPDEDPYRRVMERIWRNSLFGDDR